MQQCNCAGGPLDPVTEYACGDVICTGCGVVLPEIVFERAPYVYAASEDRPRRGPAARVSTRRILYEGPSAITRAHADIVSLGRILGLDPSSRVIGAAKELYDDLAKMKCIRDTSGKMSKTHFVTAVLYLAFRIAGSPRPLQDFPSGRDALDAVKTARTLLSDKPYAASFQAGVSPESLVFRVVGSLGLDLESKKRLLTRIASVQSVVKNESLLEGRTPGGVLSAVMYRSTLDIGLNIPKKHIAQACDVCQGTMVKLAKELNHIDSTA